MSSSAGGGGSADSAGEDVLDAFAAFNQQAQERVQTLLRAADHQASLYAPPTESECEDEDSHLPPPPAFVSDSVRLARPPDFRRWQNTFPYLQVSGCAVLSTPSDDHICALPTLPAPLAASDTRQPAERSRHHEQLVVSGFSCLRVPDERHEATEEIIAADGVMEEIVLQDQRRDDDDDDASGETRDSHAAGGCSPRTAQMHEAIDALTFECFSTAVAPLMTSFFRELLLRQQALLRAQREEAETATQHAVAARVAAEQAERRRRERQAVENAERAAAVAKAAAEEAAREAERQELLRRQQREENDDEEIRIRTLAYSHAREWLQPHKKCFSHRGRQLTYLKPVLAVRDEDGANNAEENGAQPSPARRAPANKAARKSVRTARRTSPPSSSSTQQLRLPRSSSPQQRESEEPTPRANHVRLPLINRLSAAAVAAAAEGRTSFSRRHPDDEDGGRTDASAMVHSSRPANVYAASPFRMPSPSPGAKRPPPRETRRPSAFTSSID